MEMLLRPLLFPHHYSANDRSAANPSLTAPKFIKFFVHDSTAIFSIILTFLWSYQIGFFHIIFID